MKRICYFAALLPFAVAWAVADEDPIMLDIGSNAHAFHHPLTLGPVPIAPAFEDYYFFVEDVCNAMGVQSDDCMFYVMNGDIDNAAAVIMDGNKLVVYDRELSTTVGLYGAIGILAHEVAHHYCGHTLDVSSGGWAAEVEADRFAGAAVRNMGGNLDAALEMASVLSDRPSLTHPPQNLRLAAIEEGWRDPTSADACGN